jgi:CDP-diacylglycerol--glycerol-3-phosphate 3-phosphatidyltransferase
MEDRSAVQAFTDGVIERTMLWAVPHRLRPNHVTVLRLVSVPVVYVLFVSGYRWTAFVLFVLSVCTDFLDGAMARTRDQVTELGTFIDPLADKLVVGAALLALGSDYLVIRIILISVALELVSMVFGAVHWHRSGRAVKSNIFGKLKMIFLSVGLSLFLLGRVLEAERVVDVAVWILWIALGLAVASAVKLVVTRETAL